MCRLVVVVATFLTVFFAIQVVLASPPSIEPKLECYIYGAGPIAASKNEKILCNVPFVLQQTKTSAAKPLDYCASFADYTPHDGRNKKYKNRTDLWCPTNGITLYQPFKRDLRLQWGFCECNRPRDVFSVCQVRGGVDEAALKAWHPNFQIAAPGQKCRFPFTYNGVTYFECAEKNVKDPVKEFGWCFTDEGTKTYGACTCVRTSPPTLRPTEPPTPKPTVTTLSPTNRPTTESPTFPPNVPTTRRPTQSPTTRRPTQNPTHFPTTATPTLSPTLQAKGLRFTLLITPLDDGFISSRSPSMPTASPSSRSPTFNSSSPTTRSPSTPTASPFSRSPTTRSPSLPAIEGKSPTVAATRRNNNRYLRAGNLTGEVVENLCEKWPVSVAVVVAIPPEMNPDEIPRTRKVIEDRLNIETFTIFRRHIWRDGFVLFRYDRQLLVNITGLTTSQLSAPVSAFGCSKDYLNVTLAEVGTVSPSKSPTVLQQAVSGGDGLSSGQVAGVVIGVLFGLVFLLIGLLYWDHQRRQVQFYGDPKDLALFPLLKEDAKEDYWEKLIKFLFRQPSSTESGSTMGLLRQRTTQTSHESNENGGAGGKKVLNSSTEDFSIDLSLLKLGKVIGTGANGRIFAAKYGGGAVAVKELFSNEHGDGLQDSAAEVMFREFAHLKLLRHPHVIPLYGVAVARSQETGAPRYLLVMELAETSLDKELLKREAEKQKKNAAQPASIPPVTPRAGGAASPTNAGDMAAHTLWALTMAQQIASALAFLHEKGLIHFDVKPHNVLLDKAGAAKLCDLGISKLITDRTGRDLTLTSGAKAGTPSYMAPELLKQDLANIGTPVDVYAFGILLWQLFHLHPPHPKEWSVAQLFYAVMHEKCRPTIDETLVTPQIKMLIVQCWDEDPKNRPFFDVIEKELSDAIRKLNTLTGASPKMEFTPSKDDDNNRAIEPVSYNVGDRVKVYSAAVRGLVQGTITSVSGGVTASNKKRNQALIYDIKLDTDGSTILGVRGAEIIPIIIPPPPATSGPRGKAALLLQVRGLNSTSTLADMAGALAIAKKIREPSSRDRRNSLKHTDSDSVSSPNSKASSKGASALSRFFRGRGSQETRDVDDANRSHPSTPQSGSISPKVGGIRGALTFRFLPEHEAAEEDGNNAFVAPSDLKTTSLTFRFDGSVLNLQGFLLNQDGGSSASTTITATTTAAAKDDAPSTTINHWKGNLLKIAEIGRGASGCVYSALHTSTFEIVAVKEVKFTDRAIRHQTARELKALSILNSPYIVKMYDAFFEMESSSIVMVLEYVNGGSLQDLINVSNKVPGFVNERILKKIAHDILSAFVECHVKQNVAHFDVKPSNILLGLQGFAELADFGLAKKILPSEDKKLKALKFLGTTKYMSPERLKGQDYSFPADVWGLGMSLLSAALGQYPIKLDVTEDQDVYWALLEVLQKQPETIPSLPSSFYSKEAISFVQGCLEIDPEKRLKPLEALKDHPWFDDLLKDDENSTTTHFASDAQKLMLNEVADCIVSKLRGKEGASVIAIEYRLVQRLAEQLGVDQNDVKNSLNAAAAKVKHQISMNIEKSPLTAGAVANSGDVSMRTLGRKASLTMLRSRESSVASVDGGGGGKRSRASSSDEEVESSVRTIKSDTGQYSKFSFEEEEEEEEGGGISGGSRRKHIHPQRLDFDNAANKDLTGTSDVIAEALTVKPESGDGEATNQPQNFSMISI